MARVADEEFPNSRDFPLGNLARALLYAEGCRKFLGEEKIKLAFWPKLATWLPGWFTGDRLPL